MRRFVIGLVAASTLASQASAAPLQCLSPEERTAFDVQALRSELMVLATGCNDDSPYNAFVKRYQPQLAGNEHSIEDWFKRKYGRRGQTEHDRFVTELANQQSVSGAHLGSDFCPRNGMIFAQVMALHGPAELGPFAAGQNLIPTTADICPEPTQVAQAKSAGKAPKKR
ncbi:MAG: hypothetical protein JO227_22685 [Acetobacteraceae bacterium]|nr:hypothetical protein [Acetobacteraceae bacterium]